MPISSGAGGKAARLRLVNPSSGVVVGKSRAYWPNAAAHTTAKSHSTSALNRSVSVASSRASGNTGACSTSTSVTNLNRQRSESPSSAKTATVINSKNAGMSSKQHQRQQQQHQHQRTATVEKYKQIRHISPPLSEHANTSPTVFKYFTGGGARDNIENQSRAESPELSSRNLAREHKEEEPNGQVGDEQVAASQEIPLSQAHERAKKPKSKGNQTMSSLAGQLIVTGGHYHYHQQQQQQHGLPIRCEPQTVTTTQQQTKPSSGGLFSSLMMLGGGGQKAATSQVQHQQRHHSRVYPTATTIESPQQQQQQHHHHNSQTSINPSLSFVSINQSSSSASSRAANLHSLASLHGGASQPKRSTQGLTTSTTTINKRINLKYVKTLIILLMSLDLSVTLFVHHFASHDEFSLIFTQHKLRLSLVNLVLSAIWFIVLATAILFDIYAILLIGALVDIASFILLLVCSVIHFTHRIDYNTVNLTSLLLLLFSIIVLHVYLIVIAALTIYLMMAVKRRRKH